jgi:hypothetical protein
MSIPVTIENEQLKLDIWPQFGGKVTSIIDKADGYELLFGYPAELPTRCQYGAPYADGWYAGWDECFPSLSARAYPMHPYEGIAIPDHGELWSLPTTAVPTRDGITTVWHGLRFGYRLTRKLFLDGPTIQAEYTLVNLAPFEFRFCWAQHALLSMVSPVEVELGDVELLTGAHWPRLDERTRFTRSDELPAGQAWKRYSRDPIAAPARLNYVDRRRTLEINYTSEAGLPAYWGIWINAGSWEGHHHLAHEPTTAHSDDLAISVADNTAGRDASLGRTSWQTTMRVGAAT